MEKKTIDTLRVMLCGEIEDIAKKGVLSHETLDILKDLVETEKNLAKIEKYEDEKKEKEAVKLMGSMPMDNGYSQRKFYIDADYQPNQFYGYGNKSYMDGNSYARGNQGNGNYMMYDMGNSYIPDSNSYMYYDPRYSGRMNPRYSRTGSKEEMIEELKEMMKETGDEKVKMAISEVISKIGK